MLLEAVEYGTFTPAVRVMTHDRLITSKCQNVLLTLLPRPWHLDALDAWR
jgi:hypothetical protein